MLFGRFLRGTVAIVALAVAGATPAKAVVSYDTITGLNYDGGYWPVGSTHGVFGSSVSVGVQFTAVATGFIDSLKLSLYGANSGKVIIYSDSAGSLGSPLETLLLNESTAGGTFATGTYTNGVRLQQGLKYWVLAVADSTAPLQSWASFGFGDIRPYRQFTGTAVPCCKDVVTNGIYFGDRSSGGFGLIVDIAAVPEPATWVMMVGGFGLIGAAIRRHRRPAAAASV